MARRLNLSKREALAQSKAALDFHAQAAGVPPHEFLTTMKPIVHREKKPSDRPLEREVLVKVMKRLREHPMVAFAWRTQSGVFELANGRTVTVGVLGQPDVIGALMSGRFLGCEVKRPGEDPTSVQESRLEQIRRCGGIAFVARCADDVDTALRNIF